MSKRFAVAFVILCLAGVSVRADQPVITEAELHFDNVILEDCGDFQIIENSTLTRRRIAFFRHGSGPVRVQSHFTYQGTFTNSVTGYTVTDGPDAHNFFFDVPTGELAVRGLVTSIQVPGAGVVLIDAGNLIFGADGSVTVNGPHQSLTSPGALCAAMDH